jgi:hypothetical protein
MGSACCTKDRAESEHDEQVAITKEVHKDKLMRPDQLRGRSSANLPTSKVKPMQQFATNKRLDKGNLFPAAPKDAERGLVPNQEKNSSLDASDSNNKLQSGSEPPAQKLLIHLISPFRTHEAGMKDKKGSSEPQ